MPVIVSANGVGPALAVCTTRVPRSGFVRLSGGDTPVPCLQWRKGPVKRLRGWRATAERRRSREPHAAQQRVETRVVPQRVDNRIRLEEHHRSRSLLEASFEVFERFITFSKMAEDGGKIQWQHLRRRDRSLSSPSTARASSIRPAIAQAMPRYVSASASSDNGTASRRARRMASSNLPLFGQHQPELPPALHQLRIELQGAPERLDRLGVAAGHPIDRAEVVIDVRPQRIDRTGLQPVGDRFVEAAQRGEKERVFDGHTAEPGLNDSAFLKPASAPAQSHSWLILMKAVTRWASAKSGSIVSVRAAPARSASG